MIELGFFLFLFSGIIKSYLYTFKIDIPADLTLLSGGFYLAAVVAHLVKRKELHIPSLVKQAFKKRAIVFFMIFIVWMLITISYSSSENFAWKKAYLFGTNVLALILPFFIRAFNFKRLALIMSWFTLGLGLLFFTIHPISLYLNQRDFSMLDLEAFEGVYMGLAVLASVSFVLLLRIPYRHYYALFYSSFIYILFYSGARGAILGFVLGLFILLIVRYRLVLIFGKDLIGRKVNVTRKFLSFLLISGVVSTLFFYVVNTNKYCGYVVYRSFARFGLVMDSLLESESKDSIVSVFKSDNKPVQTAQEEMEEVNNSSRNRSIVARAIHWKFSWNKITDSLSTAIFGYGLGSYGFEFTGEDGRGYPHNIFLEIWFELGLIGLTLFILFLALGLKDLSHVPIFVLVVITMIFLQTLKSGSLVDHRLFFGFFALAFVPRERSSNA